MRRSTCVAPTRRASRRDPLAAACRACRAAGDLLRGTLGGLLGGAAAGAVLNGGLGGLLKQLQESGQGDVAKSWVGTGPNKQISQGDLADALGTNTLNELSRHSGMDPGDLLSGLSRYLPRFVDELTPDGRVPSEEEAGRMV